jgi:hypothetical protein
VGEVLAHVAILLQSQQEVEAVIASYYEHVFRPPARYGARCDPVREWMRRCARVRCLH